MKDEKLITTRRLKLSDAIYYKTLLEYIPEKWDFDNTLNKNAKDLTTTELKRILMVKKHYNSILLLSHAIDKMKDENLEELQIKNDIYQELMNFSMKEIKEMKFEDEIEYIQYMMSIKCEIPNHSVINDGVNIYDNGTNSSGIKAHSHIKKHFKRGRRY